MIMIIIIIITIIIVIKLHTQKVKYEAKALLLLRNKRYKSYITIPELQKFRFHQKVGTDNESN